MSSLLLSPKKMKFLTYFNVQFSEDEQQTSDRRLYAQLKQKADAALLRLMDLEADGFKSGDLSGDLDEKIRKAQHQADEKRDYQKACEELKGYDALVKKAEDKALKKVQPENKEKIFEERVQAQKERLSKTVAKLRALPGGGERAKTLAEKLDKGAGGTFEEAYTDLQKEAEEAEEQIKKTAKAVDKLRGSEVHAAYLGALEAVKRFRDLFPDKAADEKRDEVNKAFHKVLQAEKAGDKESAAKVQEKQTDVFRDVEKQLGLRCTAREQGVVHLAGEAENNLRGTYISLLKLGATEKAAEVNQALSTAQEHIRRKEWEQAFQVLADEEKDASSVLKQTEEAAQSWKEKGPSLAEEINEGLKKLKSDAVTGKEPLEPFHEEAGELEKDVQAVLEGVKAKPNFAEALLALENCKTRLGTLQKQLEPLLREDLKKARTEGQRLADFTVKQVEAKKKELLSKLQKIDPELTSLGSVGRTEAVLNEWRQARDSVESPEELKKAAEKMQAGLLELEKPLTEALKDQGGLKDLAREVKVQEAPDRYEKERATAQAALDKLMPFGGEAYEQQLKRFRAAVRDAAAGKFVEATQAMKSIATEAGKAVGAAKKEITNKAKAAGEEADKLAEAIKKQKMGANAMFADFFEELTQELKDLRKLCEVKESGGDLTGNLTAIANAVEQMKALETRLQKLATANDPKAKKGGTGGKTFNEVLLKLKDLNSKLTDAKKLKKYLPSVFEDLNTQWQTVSGEAKKAEPDESWPALEEFEALLKKKASEAEVRGKARDKFKEDYKKLQSKVKEAGVNKKAVPSYHKELLGKMKGLRKQASTENGEGEAQKELDQLAQEFDKLLKLKKGDRGKALKGKDTEAKKREDEAAEAKKDWEEKAYPEHEKLYAETEKKVHEDPEGDASQLEGLKAMGKQAKQLAKSGQYAEAKKLLAQAKELALAIQKEPQGFKKTARKNLAGMQTRWEKAVQDFAKDVGELANKGKQWCQEHEDDRAKHLDEIKALANLFDEKAFEKPIKVLADTKSDRNARKAVREQGLRTFRRYLNALLRDPVLNIAMENPLVPLRGPCAVLLKVLKDVEFNVLTCV